VKEQENGEQRRRQVAKTRNQTKYWIEPEGEIGPGDAKGAVEKDAPSSQCRQSSGV
jgi:hypothetical protein